MWLLVSALTIRRFFVMHLYILFIQPNEAFNCKPCISNSFLNFKLFIELCHTAFIDFVGGWGFGCHLRPWITIVSYRPNKVRPPEESNSHIMLPSPQYIIFLPLNQKAIVYQLVNVHLHIHCLSFILNLLVILLIPKHLPSILKSIVWNLYQIVPCLLVLMSKILRAHFHVHPCSVPAYTSLLHQALKPIGNLEISHFFHILHPITSPFLPLIQKLHCFSVGI